MIRTLTWALMAASLLAVGTSALARNNTNLTRSEIRSMPIEARPSRPGHFYGNAVRRKTYRAAEKGAVKTLPANAWQGYRAPVRENAWIEGQTSETVIGE
jgi:hypothetical protein